MALGSVALSGLLALAPAQEQPAPPPQEDPAPAQEDPAPAHEAPAPAPSAVQLKPAAEAASGVSYERWASLPGCRVAAARAVVTGSNKIPALSGVAPSLSFPQNDGKSYLARVRGFIAPARTGTARLVLASDDNSELWLTPTGSDPFARVRVAWIIGDGALASAKPGETRRFSSQWSAPVRLEQGRRYYFELWHKQDGGPDHLSLRWQYEGDKDVSDIPPAVLLPYAPPDADADADGLPDDWQRDKGLDGRADRGSWADPDGDRILNFDEFTAGTDPLDPAPVDGALLWERWHGLYGNGIADLVRDPRFSGAAEDALLLRAGATPVVATGNHAFRLSGFLVPTESGDYQLAVTGDDATELWFSADASCLGKTRVAFGPSARARDDWEVLPCQRSKTVTLAAGQPYYFEVLQKNGTGTGWAALGWRKAADKAFTTVPASVLRSPGILPGDARHDFLPDAWVDETLEAMDAAVRPRVVMSQQGDPDRDGLPNWLEARVNTDPFARSQVMETWIREWWFNVPGNSIDLARANRVFLGRSSMVTLSHGPASEAYTADSFASRYRALVTPRISGKYRFWLAGDDQVELWLSTTGRKFHKRLIASAKPSPWQDPGDSSWTGRDKWDLRGSQQSPLIDLKAGQPYFIEVLHKDGGGDDHMSVAWQYLSSNSGRWSAREPVPASALLSYDGDDDDADDDYLPDSWERRTLLDPRDNGLSDYARQGEDGDFDKDGLGNRAEYLLGTDPRNADTDGDGETDFDEVNSLGTNPLVRDSLDDFLLAKLPVGGFTAASANWTMTSGGLISDSFRGTITWEFDVPSDGFWLFRLRTELMGVLYGTERIPMTVGIDGRPVVRRALSYPAASPLATLQALTPWLAAGRHTLTLDIDNLVARRSVRLVSLQLYTPPNAAMLLAEANRITPHPEFTRTSPACVEGYSRTPETTTVNGAPALAGTGGGHWYGNIALADHGDPQTYAVSFEQGSSGGGTLTWQATNVLDGETLTVRRGDSLRLGAWATGTGEVSTLASSAGGTWNLADRQTVAVPFPDAGTVTFRAETPQTGRAGTLTVRVIPAPGFSAEPFDTLGEVFRSATWEAAEPVEFDTFDEACRLSVTRPEAGKAAIAICAQEPGAWGLAARLGAGGAILAIQPLNAVGVSDALQNDLTTQTASPIPGYKVYHSPLTVTRLPDEGRVEIDIIRAGVMFPNGAVSRTILPEDLSNDWIDLEFLFPVGMPGAYCHSVSVYGRKGDYLGTR